MTPPPMLTARQPQRIQRSRAKGWRMPEGAVYVGRPTKWGNLYRVGDVDPVTGRVMNAEDAKRLFELTWRQTAFASLLGPWIAELRGRDLVCWCRLDQPCHADVLLEIANR